MKHALVRQKRAEYLALGVHLLAWSQGREDNSQPYLDRLAAERGRVLCSIDDLPAEEDDSLLSSPHDSVFSHRLHIHAQVPAARVTAGSLRGDFA